MSPEQAQGKTKEIDQRSDIFSFGCILFEAATGKKPFEGESVIKSLHMVVYEPAPPIADFNPAAPSELQRIVRRCFAKDPDERYQSIKEVAIRVEELRRELQGPGIDTTLTPQAEAKGQEQLEAKARAARVSRHRYTITLDQSLQRRVCRQRNQATQTRGGHYSCRACRWHHGLRTVSPRGSSNAAIKSIAVMPFVNESGNADLEYLSDGMTETLINSLLQIPNLSVKARSSVFRYKGKELDPKKIAPN